MGPAEPGAGAAAGLRIELAYSPRAGEVVRVALTLPRGATVSQALRASGLLTEHAELQQEGALRLGIWGMPCDTGTPLRDRDRIEVYRPLTVDPKEARRLRYRGGVAPKKTTGGR